FWFWHSFCSLSSLFVSFHSIITSAAVVLGPRVGEHVQMKPGSELQYLTLADWIVRGEPVYFIETNYSKHTMPDSPHGALLEFVKQYQHEDVTLKLYRVGGVTGQTAEVVYEKRLPPADMLEAAYASLYADLSTASPETVTVVFPGSQAEMVDAANDGTVIPLTLDRWPPDREEAAEVLSDLATDDKQVIELIEVAGYQTDPNQAILQAAQALFYHVRQIWHEDQITQTTYITGPVAPDWEDTGYRWEDAIDLDRVAIVDPVTGAGDWARIAYTWRTDSPVQDSFSVFTHIVDAEGNLVAQYDGIPGGGLYPLTVWQPGKPVVDRIAIRLPADLAPGDYAINVGIYSPESGLRLQVTAGSTLAPDYATIGRISVQ
ncbi:MAG: hypothetical protein JXJ17_07730, partial [Anaerolineae bacterium]|nr:hypothetical protein [Anaerolineae bacterium]